MIALVGSLAQGVLAAPEVPEASVEGKGESFQD